MDSSRHDSSYAAAHRHGAVNALFLLNAKKIRGEPAFTITTYGRTNILTNIIQVNTWQNFIFVMDR